MIETAEKKLTKKEFNYKVCKGCVYNNDFKCTRVDRSVYCLPVCPDGYTWETIHDIYADIRRRIDKSKRLMNLLKQEDSIDDEDVEMFEQEYNFV